MWEINLNSQLISIVYSFCLGIILCVFYDMFRAMRKNGFDSFMLVLICDVVFSLVCSVVTFILMLAITNGEIRIYVLAAEAVGFIFSRFTLSRLTLPFFTLICSALNKLYNVICGAICCFSGLIKRFFIPIYSKIVNFLKIAAKSVKKLLKSASDMLYTNSVKGDNESHTEEMG